MKSGNWICALVLLTCALGGTTVLSQDEGCMASECHDDMWSKKWVHGPVGGGMCAVCHEPVEGADHSFRPSAEGQDLCLLCHEPQGSEAEFSNVHSPVADGNCIGCHDPHQSDYRYQLRGQGSELCFQCHERAGFEKGHEHGPVGEGDCNACHNPHASNNTFQLIAPRDRICFECHPDKETEMTARHPHQPVQDSCTSCHSPHSDVAEYMLPQSMPMLCFDCHENVQAQMSLAVPHPPVAEGLCADCHLIHGSAYPKLFTRTQEAMCLTCHPQTADHVAGTSSRHGPVKEGDCIACHSGHGSAHPRMLHRYFPEEFYNPFSPDQYAICFNCHSEQLALDSITTSLTHFRAGDVNLHYKHVNKDVKGRSCKSCHEVHSSNQAKHIRESVPFGRGGFEYPIKFTQEEDGGTCVVGCHKPKTYRRSGS